MAITVSCYRRNETVSLRLKEDSLAGLSTWGCLRFKVPNGDSSQPKKSPCRHPFDVSSFRRRQASVDFTVKDSDGRIAIDRSKQRGEPLFDFLDHSLKRLDKSSIASSYRQVMSTSSSCY